MAAIDLARPLFKRKPPEPPIDGVTAEELQALQRDLEAMAQAPSVPSVAPPAYTVPEPTYPSIDVGPSTPGRYPGTRGEPLPYSTTPAPIVSEVERRTRSVYERSPALHPEPFDLGRAAGNIPRVLGEMLSPVSKDYRKPIPMAPSPELNLPFGYQSQEEVNQAAEAARQNQEGILGALNAIPPTSWVPTIVGAGTRGALKVGAGLLGQEVREAPAVIGRAGTEAGMAVGRAMEATARPGARTVQAGRKAPKQPYKPIADWDELSAAERWRKQGEALKEADARSRQLKTLARTKGLGTEKSLSGLSLGKLQKLLREGGVEIPEWPKGGIGELRPEWETRIAEEANNLSLRAMEKQVRLDYTGGETAARERVTALTRALQAPNMSEVRRSEILDQELPHLRAFLSQPAPYQYGLPGARTAGGGITARERALPPGAGVREGGLQAGFDEAGNPITVPFEEQLKPGIKPEAIPGQQLNLGLGEGFYIPPGLTAQDEKLLRLAVQRGDRKTIQRLMARGQGQLMEERLPYSANGQYELSSDAITTNPLHQPRKGLDEANVQRIVENYDPNRFLPIEVREINPGVFELIHGHHRLEAARRLALKRIPVRVLNVSSEDAIRLAEEANLAGQPLKPTEIARLLDKRLRQAQSPVEIVRAFPGAGIRAGQVEDYARIVNLPRIILEAVDDPVLGRQFTVQHAMRLARAQAKYSMPADEVQAFFNEVIMKQEMTPAQMERVLDNFAPVLRKESESQGALFGGGDFQGTYTGIMATIRGAVGDIKSLESLERRMKGIVSFIEAGKEVPEELAAARGPLERQVAGVRQRIVQAQKAVTGEIHAAHAPEAPAAQQPLEQAAARPRPNTPSEILARIEDGTLESATFEKRDLVSSQLLSRFKNLQASGEIEAFPSTTGQQITIRRRVAPEAPAAQPLEQAAEGAAKQSWEMTIKEYKDTVVPTLTGEERLGAAFAQDTAGRPYRHRQAVVDALREGKPVPPEVLADYPDLAAAAQNVAGDVVPPTGERPIRPIEPTPTADGAGREAPPPETPQPPSGRPPGGIPPTSPGTPSTAGSPLDRTIKMLETAERPPTIGERLQAVRASLPDRYRTWQELMTDRFAGINALSPDVEQTVARLGGLGDIQAQRAVDIATSVKKALGAPWESAGKHLDAYLHLKQAIDIEAAKGLQRLIPGGIRGAAEAQQGLAELQAMLGPQRWEQLERAAAVAVQESQATLNRLVDGGLVSRELADQLISQYPHYNKQNIIMAVEEEVRGVSRGRMSVTSANLKRLTEYGTEQARTSPYASIIGSASDAEALIARNQAAKNVALEAINQGVGNPISGVRPVAQVEGEVVFRRPAGEIPGTISYMEDGVRKVIEVPAWLEKEAKAITAASDDVLIRSVSWINALPRSAFVTYNPAWPAANLTGDYLAGRKIVEITNHKLRIANPEGVRQSGPYGAGKSQILSRAQSRDPNSKAFEIKLIL